MCGEELHTTSHINGIHGINVANRGHQQIHLIWI